MLSVWLERICCICEKRLNLIHYGNSGLKYTYISEPKVNVEDISELQVRKYQLSFPNQIAKRTHTIEFQRTYHKVSLNRSPISASIV